MFGACVDPVRDNVTFSEPGELKKMSLVGACLWACTRAQGGVPTGVCACLCTYTCACSGPVPCWGGSRMGMMGARGHWEEEAAAPGSPGSWAGPARLCPPGSLCTSRSACFVPRVPHTRFFLAPSFLWPQEVCGRLGAVSSSPQDGEGPSAFARSSSSRNRHC